MTRSQHRVFTFVTANPFLPMHHRRFGLDLFNGTFLFTPYTLVHMVTATVLIYIRIRITSPQAKANKQINR